MTAERKKLLTAAAAAAIIIFVYLRRTSSAAATTTTVAGAVDPNAIDPQTGLTYAQESAGSTGPAATGLTTTDELAANQQTLSSQLSDIASELANGLPTPAPAATNVVSPPTPTIIVNVTPPPAATPTPAPAPAPPAPAANPTDTATRTVGNVVIPDTVFWQIKGQKPPATNGTFKAA